MYVCVFACVCMCPPLRLLIISDIMWHDMNPYDWLNKFYNFYMTAVVIISKCGLRIEVCRINQPNKSKLVLYKPLLAFITTSCI